jgi:hypothetical protein
VVAFGVVPGDEPWLSACNGTPSRLAAGTHVHSLWDSSVAILPTSGSGLGFWLPLLGLRGKDSCHLPPAEFPQGDQSLTVVAFGLGPSVLPRANRTGRHANERGQFALGNAEPRTEFFDEARREPRRLDPPGPSGAVVLERPVKEGAPLRSAGMRRCVVAGNKWLAEEGQREPFRLTALERREGPASRDRPCHRSAAGPENLPDCRASGGNLVCTMAPPGSTGSASAYPFGPLQQETWYAGGTTATHRRLSDT